ncbi:uncharacterized protein Fot_35294 [Forsythia ovata]|uniref:Uncharacterized protein n=1 Tax=Forsythia ovata TaxID=205694 RepID=A0ABD1SL56_9LAMI
MDTTQSSMTLEDLKIIHENDRAIYSILLSNFWRNPTECLQIMSLWLWLERVGFSNLISKIYSLSQYSMNELADEAVICLKCVNDPQFLFSAEGSEIPLTRSLTAEGMSLKFFHDNRRIAFPKIRRLATELYAPVLADLTAKAAHEDDAETSSQNHMVSGSAPQSPSVNQVMTSSLFDESLTLSLSQLSIGGDVSRAERSRVNEVARAERSRVNEVARAERSRVHEVARAERSRVNEVARAERSRVHEVARAERSRVEEVARVERSRVNEVAREERSRVNEVAREERIRVNEVARAERIRVNEVARAERIRVNEVAREDRTMFVTFSRGYPVAESEVRQFFTRMLGNCIESFHMQEVAPDEQPLYAIIVFLRPSFIRSILNGVRKVKFTINGKHVWMRKFVPKNRNFFLPPPARYLRKQCKSAYDQAGFVGTRSVCARTRMHDNVVGSLRPDEARDRHD